MKKSITKKFLIRRVTNLVSGGESLTKNQYRREWRRGGVTNHDEPIKLTDIKQRLTLALVQKKVSEIIGSTKTGASFQIGMLASFESFQETPKLKSSSSGESECGNFDGGDQTESSLEREGIDVRGVNRLARTYRNRFNGEELPHPKMDALCDSLSDAWKQGRKALVFVRRIASVTDLKRKLDERYDRWLQDTLIHRLPAAVHDEMRKHFSTYQSQRLSCREQSRTDGITADLTTEQDRGGQDTFFSWFFRGEGPAGVLSGAAMATRLRTSTFLEDNHVARLLDCAPEDVRTKLRAALQLDDSLLEEELRALGLRRFYGQRNLFEAMQGAAVELLASKEGPWQENARRTLHERFHGQAPVTPRDTAMTRDATNRLETTTFFAELRRERWRDLRRDICPESTSTDTGLAFRGTELRIEILSAAMRLGHSLIDLYCLHIGRVMSLRADVGVPNETSAIVAILELLEKQRITPRSERDWGAYDELAEISEHFDLILDANAPEARAVDQPLSKVRQIFGTLLGRQQPVGGMFGRVSKSLVKQFRMPGYPFVLICTDVLQEGEDLHTFCAEVYHYGIAWTPSSMEQRTGRIDRVRSLAERRLTRDVQTNNTDFLQVFYPHLEDTVETLQVRRVLERMNTFLRLMHEGLRVPDTGENCVNVDREILRQHAPVPVISARLQSAFEVQEKDLKGSRSKLARSPAEAGALLERFRALENLPIVWEPPTESAAEAGKWYGTLKLPEGRRQPFTLRLQALDGIPMIRCVSPVGLVSRFEDLEEIVAFVRLSGARIAVLEINQARNTTYDVAVEGEVLLADPSDDAARVMNLIQRVTNGADELEQRLLGIAIDEPLETFHQDLKNE